MAQSKLSNLRLDVQKFAVAAGVTAALLIFILGISSSAFGTGTIIIETLGEMFPGYSSGIEGAAIGAIWAFFYGLIAGAILADIYNLQMGK